MNLKLENVLTSFVQNFEAPIILKYQRSSFIVEYLTCVAYRDKASFVDPR